jgi:hypothetical protein
MSDLVGRLRTHVAEYYSGRRNIALSGSLTLQQPKERNMAEEMAATAATAVDPRSATNARSRCDGQSVAHRTAGHSAADTGSPDRAAAGHPPGNPNPEAPPPMREPGEVPVPDELPGTTPDELPTRGPSGPNTPNPATDN